jgi:hypothetical protein
LTQRNLKTLDLLESVKKGRFYPRGENSNLLKNLEIQKPLKPR